jgi:hypothetical protein
MDKNIYKFIFFFVFFASIESKGQIMFRIDDVSMEYQNRAPSIYEVRSIGRNEILILFSEAIAPIPLLEINNYRVSTSLGTPVNVTAVRKAAGDTAGVWLQMGDLDNRNLHLKVNNLIDNEGAPLSGNDFDFTFIPTAQSGDIVFNEIMADPSPVVQLPDAEYIELKSNCNFAINVKNWILEVNGKQKVLPGKMIEPGTYLIICGTRGSATWDSYGANVEVPGLLLANDGFTLKLYSAEKLLIDSFSYKPALHREGFSDGGYSLERIDPLRSCGVYSNWETSTSEKGGTPGTENSGYRNNADNKPPTVSSVKVVNPSLLEVLVSEIPGMSSITGNIFSYLPSIPAPDSIRFNPALKKYFIYFPRGAIKNGVNYDLIINGLSDECGNRSPVEHQEFWYYLPRSGDLLISEVLFNPFPGGADFVEIYNHSGRKIKLDEVYLASRDNFLTIKSQYALSAKPEILPDAAYAAFTSDSVVLMANYYSSCPACIFKMEKFPAYNIDEGWVVLLNKAMEIIDEFHYRESMHHPLISDVKGISLERNSFSKPADDLSNWHSASKTVGFATPGYRNSANDVVPVTSRMVIVEPKIFSPNDDGFNDRLFIKLSPGEPDWMVNIRIYNENGVEIRRLANNTTIGSEDIIEWDGTKENHQKAGLGIYIIKVELFGLHGGTRQFKAACVLTDRLE